MRESESILHHPCQSEEVFDLGGEDSDGDTAGESHHDGIGNVLDDGTQSKQSEKYEEEASHQGSDGESLEAILLYDAVDDDDKRTCRSAYLHLASSEE